MALKLLILACFLATLVVSGDSAESKVSSVPDAGDDTTLHTDNVNIRSLDTCAEIIEKEILDIDLTKVKREVHCREPQLLHRDVYRRYKDSCSQYKLDLRERLLDDEGPIMQRAPSFCKPSFRGAFRLEYLSPDSIETCAEDIEKGLLSIEVKDDCLVPSLVHGNVYKIYQPSCYKFRHELIDRLFAEGRPIINKAPKCKSWFIIAFRNAYLSPDSTETCAEDIEKESLKIEPTIDCESYESKLLAVYQRYPACFSNKTLLGKLLLGKNSLTIMNAPEKCKSSPQKVFDNQYETLLAEFVKNETAKRKNRQ